MTALVIGVVGSLFLFFLIGSGVHIAAALALCGFFGVILLSSLDAALSLMGWFPYSALASFTFVALPLFILMGEFAHQSGISEAAFSSSHKWLGNLRGGLPMAVTAGCALFAKAKKTIDQSDDPFKTAARLSMVGNIIDYGINHSFDLSSEINRVIQHPVAINHLDLLRR